MIKKGDYMGECGDSTLCTQSPADHYDGVDDRHVCITCAIKINRIYGGMGHTRSDGSPICQKAEPQVYTIPSKPAIDLSKPPTIDLNVHITSFLEPIKSQPGIYDIVKSESLYDPIIIPLLDVVETRIVGTWVVKEQTKSLPDIIECPPDGINVIFGAFRWRI